jgi:hypothetical protein
MTVMPYSFHRLVPSYIPSCSIPASHSEVQNHPLKCSLMTGIGFIDANWSLCENNRITESSVSAAISFNLNRSLGKRDPAKPIDTEYNSGFTETENNILRLSPWSGKVKGHLILSSNTRNRNLTLSPFKYENSSSISVFRKKKKKNKNTCFHIQTERKEYWLRHQIQKQTKQTPTAAGRRILVQTFLDGW